MKVIELDNSVISNSPFMSNRAKEKICVKIILVECRWKVHCSPFALEAAIPFCLVKAARQARHYKFASMGFPISIDMN